VSADRGENHDPTGDISRTDGKGCSKGLTRIPGIREQCPKDYNSGSAIHVGGWSIISLRDFLVPRSCSILVLNRLGLARNLLLSSSSFGCIPSLIMRWERF
jgi:hypothetical protein